MCRSPYIFSFNIYINLQVKPATSANEDDEKQDIATRKVIKLYECSDEAGTLRIREIKSGPLEQSDLHSKDSFIIDNGNFGIWVWVGKRASPKERTEAMRNAQGFIKKKGQGISSLSVRPFKAGKVLAPRDQTCHESLHFIGSEKKVAEKPFSLHI